MINPKTAQSENVSLRRVLEHIVCVLISERLILHDCLPNNAPWHLHRIGEVTYHFKTETCSVSTASSCRHSRNIVLLLFWCVMIHKNSNYYFHKNLPANRIARCRTIHSTNINITYTFSASSEEYHHNFIIIISSQKLNSISCGKIQQPRWLQKTYYSCIEYSALRHLQCLKADTSAIPIQSGHTYSQYWLKLIDCLTYYPLRLLALMCML